MLTVNLLPQRSDKDPMIVSFFDPVLTVNGVDYDLSQIPDGATVDHPVIKQCSRSGDSYELTLVLPHGANAPQETRFPSPVTVDTDGLVELPDYDGEV